jgi:TonB family protein
MIETINETGAGWLAYFGPAVLQNTVFLALLLFVLSRARGMTARVKYGIGLIGLVKLAVPPFIPLSAVGPVRESSGAAAATISELFVFGFGSGTASTAAPRPALTTAGILALVWLGMITGYLLVAAVSAIRHFAALRGGETIGSVSDGGAGEIAVVRSSRVTVPMTFGLMPRRIFVPPAWERWSEAGRAAAIGHELAHIRRHDGIALLLQTVIQALYLFHPLVWLLNRRLGAYREMACDDATAGLERESSAAYSRCLLEIAESIAGAPYVHAASPSLLRTRNELLERIRYRMEVDSMKRISKKATACIVSCAVLLILGSSWHVGGAAAGDRAGIDGSAGSGADGPANAAARPPLPAAGEKQSKLPRVLVELENGRTVTVEGTTAELEDLKKTLREKLGGADAVIKIKCEPGVTMEQVTEVQRILHDLGLTKVSYVRMEGGDLPLMLPPPNIMKRVADLDPDDLVELHLDESGGIFIDGAPLEEPSVAPRIEQLLARNPNLIIAIETQPMTPYEKFERVLGAVKDAGAERILVNADEDFYPFDEPPKLVTFVDPAYPDEDRKAGRMGEVIVRATIDETGKVTHADVISSDVSAAMEESAVDAVMKCAFEPARKDGEPVPSRIAIPIRFKLE